MTDGPRGWQHRPLSEVIGLQRGYDLAFEKRQPGNVPVLGSFGITGSHNVPMHQGPGVTIGRSGASIGVATFTTLSYWPLNTTLFVRDFKGNDPRWVYYLLDHLDLTGYDSGSVQPMLNRNYIARFPIDLPPVAEQRSIADTLGALDDKIESNRRVVETARDFAKLSLQQAAVAGDAVRVSDIAEVRKGLSYKGSSLSNAGMPMANMGNAAPYGWLKRDGFKFYTGDYKPKHIARSGSLLVVNTEQTWRQEIIGWPMVIPFDVPEALFTHHVFLVELQPDWAWTRWALWAHLFSAQARELIDGRVYGTTVATLPAAAIADQIFTPPPRDSAVIAIAESLLRRAWASEVESITLATVRDALLPDLLSGRLRVPEAREHIEALA